MIDKVVIRAVGIFICSRNKDQASVCITRGRIGLDSMVCHSAHEFAATGDLDESVASEDVENDAAVSENRRSIDVITGSLCLFPSSLLHYTSPFNANPFNAKEKRVVLAFDMIPL